MSGPITKPYPIYVSYATEGRYAKLLERLRESAKSFDLIFKDVVTPHRFDSWQKAAAYKRHVIRHFWNESEGKHPIVWVDADAVFRGYPAHFDTLGAEVDFAACWRLGHELLSGTLYFGATSSALRVLDEWDRFQAMDPDNWDQRTLAAAVNAMRRTIRAKELPMGYCYIFDRTGREYPGTTPVIEHFQASREEAK